MPGAGAVLAVAGAAAVDVGAAFDALGGGVVADWLDCGEQAAHAQAIAAAIAVMKIGWWRDMV